MDISKDNKNTLEVWDKYFTHAWEENHGPEQTRLFAEYFNRTIPLMPGISSLMDVGCGMGDAVGVFRKYYPDLQITGCDISDVALSKARETYGELGNFKKWGFYDIEGFYDIIYCSNVLEHFETYLDIAQHLLKHCRWLYIMVPYKEMQGGRPLEVRPEQWHVATFYKSSFDPLERSGAGRITRRVIRRCPRAWGPNVGWFFYYLGYVSLLVRRMDKGYWTNRQIFFEIESLSGTKGL